jgi:hypothetical protein
MLKDLATSLLQSVKRIRCWWRGWHVHDASHVGKFRYDVSGMCYDCGKVGTGKRWTDGE